MREVMTRTTDIRSGFAPIFTPVCSVVSIPVYYQISDHSVKDFSVRLLRLLIVCLSKLLHCNGFLQMDVF